MKLVIFDLDQTLVELLPVHNRAAEEVFQKFFHVKARLTEVDFAGRSLTENFIQLARLKKVREAEVRGKSQEMLEYYQRAFAANFPRDPSRYILPGVKRLLKHLSSSEHMVVLYTGDSGAVAEKILTATGLGKYFRFAVYGTEVPSRADMVRLAIVKAEKLAGHEFQAKDIVIIGDSIRDIECGRQFNARTIAVATGFHTVEELLEHRPDYIFESLKDYKKVLQAIDA